MADQCYIATRKGLFRVDRGAAGWAIDGAWFLGDDCTNVLADPRDGAVYVAIKHGHFGVKLHRSDDECRSWNEIGVPAYPERPADAPEVAPTYGTPAPWSLQLAWELVPDGDEPGGLWCGTIPGGLFHSPDRGATWSLNRALWDDARRGEWFGGGYDHPGIHSICVDPRDARRVVVGVSCGGVWATGDRGATWTLEGDGLRAEYMPPERAGDRNIQDPHRLVRCPAAPETMWIQHHNGIFRSDDAGATWREFTGVQPSVFGFAVEVHPRRADTAWFVPAIKDERRIPVDGRVVVIRTEDGGRSFDVLGRGLPSENAYDLVFRHGLDVDESGDRLVLGSTTGSLWVSEDGGDGWTTVSANLPPVHAVQWMTQLF